MNNDKRFRSRNRDPIHEKNRYIVRNDDTTCRPCPRESAAVRTTPNGL